MIECKIRNFQGGEVKKVVDYQLVYATTDTGLVKHVRQQLVMGWQPLGGVSIISSAQGVGTRYTQAMVLYEKSDA